MSLRRNATYNLVGFLMPAVLAVLTVPAYLHVIGVERYGVLALAWAILGYFGLFDLGLGRATTQRLAALRNATPDERATALRTALIVNAALGIAGGATLFIVGRLAFAYVIPMEPALRHEALAALPFLALALPVATSTGVLSGALMGRERFLAVNLISVSSTVLLQVVPLALAWLLTPALPVVLGAAVVARTAAVGLLYRSVRIELHGFGDRWNAAEMRRLLSFGGWVTVSSAIGPILVLVDRFVIGALSGPVAVTIYTVPMDVSSRLGGVAAAVGNALFPRLAATESDDAAHLMRRAVRALYTILTPIVAATTVLLDPILRLWLGDAIGGQAAPVARILFIAWWLNAFAQMPFARIQADGRPATIGKLHLLEAPFYIGLLWLAVVYFGLIGAALTFLVRIVVDTVALAILAGRGLGCDVALGATLLALLGFALWLGFEPAIQPLGPSLVGAVAIFTLALIPSWLIAPADIRVLARSQVRRALRRRRG
jgi:O-antigen/teichoic acid export membrane protein